MLKNYIIIFLLIIFYSCQSKFEGYTDIGSDIYLKLISFENEQSKSFNKGDYVSISLETKGGKEGENFRIFKYNLYQPKSNQFDKVFNQLNEGDSVELLINPKTFNDNGFGFKIHHQKEYIKVGLKVHQFYNQEQYNNYINNIDNELVEHLILKNFIKSTDGWKNIHGVYKTNVKEGSGDKIKNGDTVYLRYTGYFLNGIVFDNAFQGKDFEYVYGTPNQMIEGFEKVLKTMKNGEKAKIIIPSQFAFGDKGSSTGIVPPYQSVLYNVEIINIK